MMETALFLLAVTITFGFIVFVIALWRILFK